MLADERTDQDPGFESWDAPEVPPGNGLRSAACPFRLETGRFILFMTGHPLLES